MINPETDAFVVGERVLGFADQIGNSATHEEIHAAARAAITDLESCAAGALNDAARLLARALIQMVEAEGPAITNAAEDALQLANNLRQLIADERQRREGSMAA